MESSCPTDDNDRPSILNEYYQHRYNTMKTVKSRTASTGQKGSENTTALSAVANTAEKLKETSGGWGGSPSLSSSVRSPSAVIAPPMFHPFPSLRSSFLPLSMQLRGLRKRCKLPAVHGVTATNGRSWRGSNTLGSSVFTCTGALGTPQPNGAPR